MLKITIDGGKTEILGTGATDDVFVELIRANAVIIKRLFSEDEKQLRHSLEMLPNYISFAMEMEDEMKKDPEWKDRGVDYTARIRVPKETEAGGDGHD